MGPKSSSGRAHTVRVVIADDNVLMPVAVGALLEPDADIEVAGVSYEADRILPLVAELQPDLLLLNSEMPGTDGLAFLDRLRDSHPSVAVVLLAETRDANLTSAALARGAKAVIVKGSHPGELAPALRSAARGESPRPKLVELPRAVAEEVSTTRRAAMVRLRRVYDDAAARLETLRAVVDRALFGNDYDWLE